MPRKLSNFVKNNLAVIIILVVVLAIAGGSVYYIRGLMGLDAGQEKIGGAPSGSAATAETKTGPGEPKSGAAPAAIAEISGYDYSQTYLHPDLYFSFNYPAGFEVTSLPDGGGEVILVNNIKKRIGAQILITEFVGAETDLTEAFIQAEIPDLEIKNAREVAIGSSKGLAFISDNEAFNGESSEIWFVYDGNLYQISAYAELDGFLRGLFSTWRFE